MLRFLRSSSRPERDFPQDKMYSVMLTRTVLMSNFIEKKTKKQTKRDNFETILSVTPFHLHIYNIIIDKTNVNIKKQKQVIECPSYVTFHIRSAFEKTSNIKRIPCKPSLQNDFFFSKQYKSQYK